MSFFRKIIDWFYEEEEEVVEKVEPHHNHDNFQKKPRQVKQQKNQTEIEAKIQYRYPKDNFKFPLISDEELLRLKEQKKLQKEAGGQKEAHMRKTEHNPSFSSRNLSYQRIVPKQEPKQTKIMQNKIPFRRTEIPSPIYGFQNRQSGTKYKKPVEYELPSETTLDSVLAIMHGKKENSARGNQENPTVTKQVRVSKDNTDESEVRSIQKQEQETSVLHESKALHIEKLENERVTEEYPHSVIAEEEEVAAAYDTDWADTGEAQVAEEMNETVINSVDFDLEEEAIQEESTEDMPVVYSAPKMKNTEENQLPSSFYGDIEKPEAEMRINPVLQLSLIHI